MSNEEVLAFLRKNVISVTCVAVSIGIGFVLYYRNDNLPDAEKVLQSRTQEGELLAANIEDSNQLKEQQGAMVDANQVISDRMIQVGQLADNLQYFYRLESETGIKILDLRQNAWTPPSKNAAKTFFTPVGFQVSVQGDYSKLLDLLRRLETGEHYCRLISCDVRPVDPTNRGGQLTVSINLELLGTE